MSQQETQLMLTNRATRLEVSQGHHANMVPFDILDMVSYQCAIITRRFSDI